MAYIQLPIAEELGREFPGILRSHDVRPEAAAPLNEATQIVEHGYSGVTAAPIATLHR
jgi:hypothetical protein